MEKISIIVPFYNVESYIKECLESLVNQTYENIEILCIDDCSTDNSSQIVKDFKKTDKRIQYIKHKVNKRQGGARNTGIKYSKGKYICFVDSDDYVSEYFIESLYSSMNKTKSDIVVCNIWNVENEKITPELTNFKDNTYSICNDKNNVLEISRQFNPGCANKMYNREMLLHNEIFQPENCNYEDVVFWLKAVFHSNKVSGILDRLYFYRRRTGSTMKSLTFKHIDDRLKFIREINHFVKDKIIPASNENINKIQDDALIYISRHINYGKQLISETNTSDKGNLEEYYKNEILKFINEYNFDELKYN